MQADQKASLSEISYNFRRIEVPGFSDVWLVDPSTNPTGTHKDELAQLIVNQYEDTLRSGDVRLSVITSGGAGIAIQAALKRRNLAPLKCLLDRRISKAMINQLKLAGCDVYLTDLTQKALTASDILKQTDNVQGIDVTSLNLQLAYPELCATVMMLEPDYCMIPYGSGQLYHSIIHSFGRAATEDWTHCQFLAATVEDPSSIADKLYAPFRPFSLHAEAESDLHIIDEKFLHEAIRLARVQQIDAEPSALAGLGLLLQNRESIDPDKKIVVVSTGRLKPMRA